MMGGAEQVHSYKSPHSDLQLQHITAVGQLLILLDVGFTSPVECQE